MAYVALTQQTARIGMRVVPTDARTMLPARYDVYTIRRFIYNDHGQPCAILSLQGRHDDACVTVDSLWLKS